MAIGVNLFYNSMDKAVPCRETAHIAVPRGHVGKWLWHRA